MARMDDLSWGASSSSSKKRSLPQTLPPASAKRPKQGPFLELSSSEDESGTGDDNGCIRKGHIAMASERPARSRTNGDHPLTDAVCDASMVETNRRGHPYQAPESLARRGNPSASQQLNRDRMRALLAKKQGVSAAPSLSPRKSANLDLRNRPLNAKQTHQDVHSPLLGLSALSLQRGGRTQIRGEGLLQARRGRSQSPGSRHATNSNERTQRTSKSTASQEAQTVRMQSAVNSNFSRNTFNTAKAGHGGAAREAGKVGSISNTNQVERPMKSAHRPEVGARFGHTLRSRKSHKQEKESASAEGVPATTSKEMHQNSGFEDCSSSTGASLASKRTLSGGSTAPSALKITPPSNRTSASPFERPSPNARQSATKLSEHRSPLPEVSGKETVDNWDEHPYQSSHATAGDQRVSDILREFHQGGTGSSDLTSIDTEQFGRARSGDGLGSGKTLTMAVVAHGKHSKQLTNACVHSVESDAVAATKPAVAIPGANATKSKEPLATLIESGAQLKIPIAVMVRPDELGGQNPKTHEFGKRSSPDAHVLDNGTSRNASPFDVIKRPQTSSDAVEAGADPSSAQDRDEEHWISEAPEPMNLSNDQPDSLMPEKGSEGVFEPSDHDAVAKHVSLGSTDSAKPVVLKSVDDDRRRRNVPASSASEATQHEAPLERPATNVDLENTCTQSAASSFPPSVLTPHHTVALDTHEIPKDVPVDEVATTQSSTLVASTERTLPSPTTSPTAERYFEYSIHQSVSLPPFNVSTTELSAQPFMTINGANAQADKLLMSAKQQYDLFGMQCRSTTTKTLDTGLSVHEAAFTSIEDPSKILSFKLWVERAEVGIYANHTPPPSTIASPLISKTLYALRLWRLVEEATDSESEVEDEDDDTAMDKLQKEQVRVYQALPNICTELHTSLDSANRAAKRVQVELSHEKAPKSMQEMWQTEDMRALHRKLDDLKTEIAESVQGGGESPSVAEVEEGRRKGCWRSVFNGYGPGGNRFELLVTSVGLSGPRNL